MIILMGKDSTDLEMIQQETTGSHGTLKRSSQAIMSKPSFFKSIAEHANMRKGRSENTVVVQISFLRTGFGTCWRLTTSRSSGMITNSKAHITHTHTHAPIDIYVYIVPKPF